jgi:hypothetical protein
VYFFGFSIWPQPPADDPNKEISPKKAKRLDEARIDLSSTHPAVLPVSLKCSLTQAILRKPVITKYGHVYEGDYIRKHLEQNTNDPLTMQSLNIDDLYEFPELIPLTVMFVQRKKEYLARKDRQLTQARAISHGTKDDLTLFICPKSKVMIKKAMIAVDGTIYDEQSLKECNYNVSNQSGKQLTKDDFEPFDEVTQQIRLYLKLREQHDRNNMKPGSL